MFSAAMLLSIAIAVLSLFASCTSKENAAQSSDATLTTPDAALSLDEQQGADSAADYDSTDLYIGFINTFTDSRELYTSLYYRSSEPENLSDQVDSTIYNQDEIIRRRLPMKIARKFFAMDGLDTVIVFNKAHQPIGEAKLVRAEYYDEAVAAEYVAVFDGKVNFREPAYCVTRHKLNMSNNFSTEQFNDDNLAKILLTKAGKDTTLQWVHKHCRVMPANVIYSNLSSETESIITEYANGNVTILADLKNDYHFDDLLPLPFSRNNKPLMLISASVPETDMFWSYLAMFEKGEYKALSRGRVKLE